MAITADKVAREAEFFSFGTNDLAQAAQGASPDEGGQFLNCYLNKGI